MAKKKADNLGKMGAELYWSTRGEGLTFDKIAIGFGVSCSAAQGAASQTSVVIFGAISAIGLIIIIINFIMQQGA